MKDHPVPEQHDLYELSLLAKESAIDCIREYAAEIQQRSPDELSRFALGVLDRLRWLERELKNLEQLP